MPVAEAAADILYIMLPHDPNADSPGVAMMQVVGLAMTLAVLSPVFGLFVWFVYRRYAGAQPLFSFGRARPFLSSAFWLLFGGFALLFLSGVLFIRRIPDLPWAAHGVLAAYFLLSCNAVLLATYASHAKA